MSQPTCALGLDSQALSAWRSHLLTDAAQERRIAQHVLSCPACQRTLSAYERIATAVRSQRVPSPSPMLWRDVQARLAQEIVHDREGDRPVPMTRSRQRATLAGIADAAGIAALFALVFGAFHALGPVVAPTATSTAARPTASAAVPSGWTAVGPVYGQAVAVAPSAPTTVYACGLDPKSAPDGKQPITVGVSHDDGTTWQAVPESPGPGASCFGLRVSPVDPRYLALTVNACAASGCSNGAPIDLRRYVSADGGAYWTRLTLPADASASQTIDAYVWAGTTLFVTSVWNTPRPSAGHVLAASANGGPLAWADQNGLLAGVPSQVATGGLFMNLAARDATLYFTMSGPGCTGRTQCRELWQTSDGGTTWTHATSIFAGEGVTIIAAAPGGAPLLALQSTPTSAPEFPPGRMLRSTDGGATWTALPAFPAEREQVLSGLAFEAPDGSIFMQLQTGVANPGGSPAEAVYTLRSGSSAWTLVFPMGYNENQFRLAAIAWDAAGHPTTLWSLDRDSHIWRHAL